MRDTQPGQPPGRLREHPVERLEHPLDSRPAVRAITGQPDRDRDDVLADIDRGAPLIHHLHACLLGKGPRHAPPAESAGNQELILAFATQPGTPEDTDSSVNLVPVSRSQAQPTSAGNARTAILIPEGEPQGPFI